MRDARSLLRGLFAAAVQAVEPAQLVTRRLRRDGATLCVEGTPVAWRGATIIAGAGKASARMAQSAVAILGSDLVGGVILAPHGGAASIPGIEVLGAGHPLPDTAGERATRRLMDVIAAHPEAAVLGLISGGASSLLVQPRPPLTLADKTATNSALLASGAEIHEFNTVRKHLSLVKGGGLVRLARGRPLVSLIVSDVIGDDPATIGSGPTAADPTTFADALSVLERYDLLRSVPRSALDLLRMGRHGEVPETLKPGAAEIEGVSNIVVGSNRLALAGAAEAAGAAGYDVRISDEPVAGDTATAARRFVAWVRAVSTGRRNSLCLLAGGETTVNIGGAAGKGGRNQEFALVCAPEFAETDVHLLSAGTDGIDGPTDAAGAFVDGATMRRAQQRGVDAGAALANHDSYRFFETLADLFQPGPTGTNVMDIKIVLMGGPS